MQETRFDSWVGKIQWRRDRLPTLVFLSFPGAQLVKNLPAVWETWVLSLGWDDSLEKGKATHSSILAWRIPWTVQSIGSQRVGHDWVTFTWHCRLLSIYCMAPFPFSVLLTFFLSHSCNLAILFIFFFFLKYHFHTLLVSPSSDG